MKEEPCPIWSRVNAGGEILKEGVGRKSRWRHWQQWIRESPPRSPSAEQAMAPHSSALAWRIPGMGEPGGLPSTGPHRVRHDWSDLAAAAAAKSFGGKQKVSGLLMAQSMAFSYFLWLFYERWLQNGWRL